MTNQQTLTKEQVACLVKGKGTKIATVKFVKSDGAIRIINGLFKPSSKIVGSDRGVALEKAMKKRGQIPVYSLKDKSWKSFFADQVLEIK
jgi:hypothetical protein